MNLASDCIFCVYLDQDVGQYGSFFEAAVVSTMVKLQCALAIGQCLDLGYLGSGVEFIFVVVK